MAKMGQKAMGHKRLMNGSNGSQVDLMPGHPSPTAAVGTDFFRRDLHPNHPAGCAVAEPPVTDSDRVGNQ
jgi:hypothetical protein